MPQMLSYQGKLTDMFGLPVADTTYSVAFRLYTQPSGGSPFWNETQTVRTRGGLFSTLLGSVTPVSTVPDAGALYMGMAVAGGAELTPRLRIVSAAYAYLTERAANADRLQGKDTAALDDRYVNEGQLNSVTGDMVVNGAVTRGDVASDFTAPYADTADYAYTAPATDSARVAGDAHQLQGRDTTDLDDRYVDTGGDQMTGRLGIDFTGSSTQRLYGTHVHVGNSSTGGVTAGFFRTRHEGSETHVGVKVEAMGTTGTPVIGVDAYAANLGSATGIAVNGWGNNNNTGDYFAGSFNAETYGSGTHYGVHGIEQAGGAGAAVYGAGDIACSGTKSAVVRTSRGERLLYCLETPDVWFEDFGSGRLVNGGARIELDPLFLETVTIDRDHALRVYVQLTSGTPVPVVVSKGLTGFDVISNPGVNADFDYRVLARRKGYERERMRSTDVGKYDVNLYPERRAEIEKKLRPSAGPVGRE